MAIVLRAKTDPSPASGSSFSVNKPAGTAAGDLLIMTAHGTSAAPALLTPPAGWYEIRDGSINGVDWVATWVKLAGGSEPSSYTVTSSASQIVGLGLFAFYSDSAAELYIADVAWRVNASDTDRTFSSVDFPDGGGYWLTVATLGSSLTSTPPGGYTEHFDVGLSGNRALAMGKAGMAAGATGTLAATGSAVTSKCISIALAEGAALSHPCPRLRSYSAAAVASVTTTVTATIPADAAEGDLLVLHLTLLAERTVTTPTGWTAVEVLNADGGAWVYSRVAEAGDAGQSVAITISYSGVSTFANAVISAYFSPAGRSLSIEASDTQTNSTAPEASWPSLTVSADALLVCLLSDNASDATEPSDDRPFWERYQNTGNNTTASMFAELLTAAGASGTRIADFTSTATASTYAVVLAIVEVSEGILFNGTDLRPYLRSWALESNARIADTTIVTSTAREQLPTIADWVFSGSGLWAAALDDVFGAQVAQSQDANNSWFLEIGGAVSYASDTTFVSRYRVDATIDNVLIYQFAIAISGNPTRSVL